MGGKLKLQHREIKTTQTTALKKQCIKEIDALKLQAYNKLKDIQVNDKLEWTQIKSELLDALASLYITLNKTLQKDD